MQLIEAYCILHDHVFSVVKSSRRNLSTGTTSQEIGASTTSQ